MPRKSDKQKMFEEELKGKGFNDKTIKTLGENDFIDKKAAAISYLEISLQQKLLLKGVVGATAIPDTHDAAGGMSGKLQDILGSLLAGEKPAAPASQQSLPETMDPSVYLQGWFSQEKTKYLDIIDYVNMIPPMSDEQVVCEDGGISMVVRSGTKWPQLENVSVEEWALANTRIMYTIKMCQLFKQFDRHSGLQFDRKYMYLQSLYTFCWGTDTPFLHIPCLRPKALGPGHSNMGNHQALGAVQLKVAIAGSVPIVQHRERVPSRR
jgi:hypothetical protein